VSIGEGHDTKCCADEIWHFFEKDCFDFLASLAHDGTLHDVLAGHLQIWWRWRNERLLLEANIMQPPHTEQDRPRM